jgi:hypothetical protein
LASSSTSARRRRSSARLRARLELDQRRHRRAVAAAARQAGDRDRVDAAVAAEDEQRVDAAARERAVERVAGLERELRGVDLVALHRPHPALHADDDGDRLVDDAHLGDGALLRLDQRAALVAERLGVGLDLADHRALRARRAGQDLARASAVRAQLLQLLLDLDRLEPRELAQPDVEDVVGLPLAQRKRAISAAFGSSASRMIAITSSMCSRTSCRPSRMWMRSATLPRRCRERARPSRAEAIHSPSSCAGSSASAGRRRRPSSG